MFSKEELETIEKFFDIVDKHELFIRPEDDDSYPELQVNEYLEEEFTEYYYSHYDKPSEYAREMNEQRSDMYRLAGL